MSPELSETFTAMLVGMNSGAVWEIDYIRVWEALPKDAEDKKDEKNGK